MRFDRTDLIYRLRHTWFVSCFSVFVVFLCLGVEARSRRGRGEVEVFRAVATAVAIAVGTAVATAVAIDRLFD